MTLHPPLEVTVREADGIHFVIVHGRLTIGDPSEHLSSFVQKLTQSGARKIIVDLNDIPQIDSSGISGYRVLRRLCWLAPAMQSLKPATKLPIWALWGMAI